jgi:hypothetical protein
MTTKSLAVDVGSYGKEGDAGILAKSHLTIRDNAATLFPENKHNQADVGFKDPFQYFVHWI